MFYVLPFQWNISMRHKWTGEHRLSYFSSKAIFTTILRMENIGKIYHKHKISVKFLILTWPKCWNKISKENSIQISVKKSQFHVKWICRNKFIIIIIIFIKLKVSNETLNKRKIGKSLIYNFYMNFRKYFLMIMVFTKTSYYTAWSCKRKVTERLFLNSKDEFCK